MFYFRNVRWIYLRPGRAISLDRKFNTAVTEASIKIDENVPADGKDRVCRRVILESKECRFLAGKIHRDKLRKIRRIWNDLLKKDLPQLYVKVSNRMYWKDIFSSLRINDLSIIYKSIEEELLLYIDPWKTNIFWSFERRRILAFGASRNLDFADNDKFDRFFSFWI